jgi:hypothetical protein
MPYYLQSLDQLTCYKAVIFHGRKRLDGSTAEISVKHKLICASAAELIDKAAKDMAFAWIGQLPSFSCQKKKPCLNAGRRVFYDIFHKPFGALQGLTIWDSSWSDGLCEPCVKMAKDAHEKGRREMWNFVPIAFELGEWESLTNF